LDCKETQPVHSEGDQPWDFFGRNDAKAETPVLWPPHVKSWLIGKDSDAGKDWGQEEKGTTEDEMAGWHHWLDGRESGWTPGVGDGQGGLVCCDSWGHKESDMTEWLIWSDLICVCCYHLFLISSASARSIPFMSFIVPIFAWNVPLLSLVFLKRSLVFPILLLSSISLHWFLRKAFLSILAILQNSAFKWVYLSFSPLPFASLLYSAICKASSDNHFAFLYFFFFRMVTDSCTMSGTSVYSSSGTLADLI